MKDYYYQQVSRNFRGHTFDTNEFMKYKTKNKTKYKSLLKVLYYFLTQFFFKVVYLKGIALYLI